MPKPNTSESGTPSPVYNVGMDFGGLPWSSYIDDREYAVDLQWRGGKVGATPIYAEMEAGDAQLKGLLLATTLPVRRLRWEVDPNGAEQIVIDHIADAFNLPVRGQEPGPRPTSQFNHDRHLAHALRAIVYGHYYFERVYAYSDPREGGDGRFHLAKLATRPPRTIENFRTDRHGALQGIVQNVGVDNTRGTFAFGAGIEIDANALLPYVWDSQDDGDWVGRSMLRSAYKNWVLKDRLIRTDATKHERNGMGVPHFEVEKGTSQEVIDNLAEIAQGIRAGTRGGSAGPGRLRIAAPEGSIPDTVASVEYHDQQMGRSFLAMFMELGTSQSGSRALGSEFIDFHLAVTETIADWYVEQTQAQVDDDVLTNFGDVQTPRLAWSRIEPAEATLQDLAVAVDKGLIVVSDEFRAYVAQRYKVPGQRPEDVPPAPAPAPAPEPPEERDTDVPAAAHMPARSALAEAMVAALDQPMTWPALAQAVGRGSKDGTARRARDQLVADGAILKTSRGTLAPMTGLKLPERELRRQPKDFEVEAAVDFAEMETVHVDAVEALVADVRAAQAAQVSELAGQVEAAAGDVAKLARLECDPVPVDLIDAVLQDVAAEGVASARQERDAQISGPQAVAAAEPSAEKLDKQVRERAEAAALTLAAGLSTAASKKAAAVATLAPDAAAAQVDAYLTGLSDAALTEQLGGAVQQAYNTGRRNYMAANEPQAVYASALLDARACSTCIEWDGREFASVAEAEQQFPSGGNSECQGGLHCRCTVVSVY